MLYIQNLMISLNKRGPEVLHMGRGCRALGNVISALRDERRGKNEHMSALGKLGHVCILILCIFV